LDILLVGNDFGNEIFIGRLDALNGLVLLGDGKGGFTPAKSDKSGFIVPGDAKALVKLSSVNGSPLYIASQNRGELKVFRSKNQESQSIEPSQEVSAILVELENGKTQRIEVNHGSGFLSQSSREIILPKGLKSLKVVDYTGAVKDFDLSVLD
jgi:hypothetical protein